MLKVGSLYSRDEIHAELGGGVQDYLPHRDGKVVCGCFTPDLNPDAPDVILAGDGPEIIRWARVFAAQRLFVPVFMKVRTNEWEYVGRFRVAHFTEDSRVLERFRDRSGRDDVSGVLILEQE